VGDRPRLALLHRSGEGLGEAPSGHSHKNSPARLRGARRRSTGLSRSKLNARRPTVTTWHSAARSERAIQGGAPDSPGADDVPMQVQNLPENVPTPTNSFVIFVVLCLFILGGVAFAKFMQDREGKRRGD
jgi:hypothetical protein